MNYSLFLSTCALTLGIAGCTNNSCDRYSTENRYRLMKSINEKLSQIDMRETAFQMHSLDIGKLEKLDLLHPKLFMLLVNPINKSLLDIFFGIENDEVGLDRVKRLLCPNSFFLLEGTGVMVPLATQKEIFIELLDLEQVLEIIFEDVDYKAHGALMVINKDAVVNKFNNQITATFTTKSLLEFLETQFPELEGSSKYCRQLDYYKEFC